MLTALSIKNYALIDDLNVTFNKGLTIITGETGAGKSILLGGLSLILGKRADLSSIKDNSRKCIIEATFDIAGYNLQAFFKEEDLDYETETIIRREILPSGKSRAFINDSPVTLTTLSDLGNYLIDIHSQHQTLELMNDDFQFQILDALSNNQVVLEDYRAHLKTYSQLQKDLTVLKQEKAEAIKEYDYNLFLFNELNEANIEGVDLPELESEYEALNNVEDIKAELLQSYQLLSDEQIGILQTITTLKNSLSKLTSLSSRYNNIYERVTSVSIELDDVFGDIENAQEALDADPNRLEEINQKLQTIHNLLLKHSAADVQELTDIKEELSHKVLATQTIDESIEGKEQELEITIKTLNSLSEQLHTNRNSVIPELQQQLEGILADLGMENARFNIGVSKTTNFLSTGKDELSFLFSANKGGNFSTLKKAASGGELSRIMLAVKYIMSKYMKLPSIMFDEIDTGVSGEVSNKMAIIMQQMSAAMQVFTITHLPQIAAKGHRHYKVFKSDKLETTITQMVELSEEERIVEIAQMLGGKEMSNSAIAHAKQLLN